MLIARRSTNLKPAREASSHSSQFIKFVSANGSSRRSAAKADGWLQEPERWSVTRSSFAIQNMCGLNWSVLKSECAAAHRAALRGKSGRVQNRFRVLENRTAGFAQC